MLKGRKTPPLILATVVLMSAFSLAPSLSSKEGKKTIVVFLDLKDLLCHPCIHHFLGLSRELNFRRSEREIFGVLCYRIPEGSSPKAFMQVVEKKLKGFLRANSIEYPFFIDHHHHFNSLADGGISLVVCDSGVVKKYVLPLAPEQKAEILDER